MNTKKHPHLRRALVALALSALFAAVPARAINAIVNDAFTSDVAPWSLQLASGIGVNATLTSSLGWGRVVIANGGTSRSHVNLEHTLSQPLVTNAYYTISFDAYSSVNKSIDVLLRNTSAIYHASYGVSLTPTPARYNITYQHTAATTTDVDLSFRIGGNTAIFYVDNVVVTRQGQTSSLMTRTSPTAPWTFPSVSVNINGTSNPVQTKPFKADAFNFSYAGYNYGEREIFVGIPTAADNPACVQNITAAQNTDITQKIIDAIAALPATLGGTVNIPAGNYFIGENKIGDAIVVSKNNVVIKGAGMGLTILNVHPTYHSAALVADRQDATFGKAVINFVLPLSNDNDSGDWINGSAPGNAAFVTVPILLGDKLITVSDPSNTLIEGATVNIRQIMWPAFVEANAYVAGATKPWKWTTYNAANEPLFNVPKYGLSYIRKIVKREGNLLTLDIPLPHDLDPANKANATDKGITVVPRALSNFVQNSGLQDLSFAGTAEDGVSSSESSMGTTVMATGLMNGLFKNVSVLSFRSLGLATGFAVNTSFINCSVSNAANCGGGGAGYGFYIRGQNLLYKNCFADNVRHGYTTAAPQTSNIVIKNCSALNYRFNTGINSGETVDDTHLQYSHGILWDNHYSKGAGLMMVHRGNQSGLAYQTCGWGIVWNYENEGINPLSPTGNDLRRNLIGITPGLFGIVVGAHSAHGLGLVTNVQSKTSPGIRVADNYTRINGDNMQPADWGSAITTATAQVGGGSKRVLFEHSGSPVAESIYDIQFAQRTKVLPLVP